MHDRVDLRGFHDAGQDRIALVGADVFGALEFDLRLDGVEADDHFDVGVHLQRLGGAAAPEAAETGDENALAHETALPEPDRRARAQHVVERVLDLHADAIGLVHHEALGVALLIGRHVEVAPGRVLAA